MIQSTHRKMLRLIIQTKRTYKKTQSKDENKVIEEVGKPENEKDGKEDNENLGSSEGGTEYGHSSNTNCDQDSDISFMNETDEEKDTAVIEEEDWIEYMKRSTDEAIEQMQNTKIQCWIKTHRRMKWRLAMGMASLPVERWAVKAADWNPELSTKNKTYRAPGRPERRWEDEINEFLKPEETETTTGNYMKYNSAWIKVAKNRGRWLTLEREYAKTAEERSVDNVLRRENPQQDQIRPARYLNGFNLEDDEVANITKTR